MSVAASASSSPAYAAAADRIDACLSADVRPATQLANYVYDGDVVEARRYVPLPGAICAAYDAMQCAAFLGLLPDIDRAYVTVDNVLFLFDYRTGQYCTMDALDQVIVCVGLVRPRPGVFVDDIAHVLVVCTAGEIVLVGVRHRPDDRTVDLVTTSYAAAADGVHMLAVAGTDDGRIFTAGKDGRLYEIEYRPGQRWFAAKCRKVNGHGARRGSNARALTLPPVQVHHTTLLDRAASLLLPFAPLFASRDPLVDLLAHPERRVIVALTAGAALHVYDIAGASVSAPRVLSGGALRDAAGAQADPAFAVVSISADHAGPGFLCLVTNRATRLFVDDDPLRVQAVRVCPRYVSAPAARTARRQYKPCFVAGQSPSNVRRAAQAHDCLLVADLRDTLHDTLVAMTTTPVTRQQQQQQQALQDPNPASSAAAPPVAYDENVEAHAADARVHAMAAVSPYRQQGQGQGQQQRHWAIDPSASALALQHVLPATQFLVLTATRLTVLTVARPIDRLASAITSSSSDGAPALQALVDQYGPGETCAMLLALICCPPVPSSAAAQYDGVAAAPPVYVVKGKRRLSSSPSPGTDPSCALLHAQEVRQAAIQRFLWLGGGGDAVPGGGAQHQQHEASSSSPALSALYVFAARLVRVMWSRPVLAGAGAARLRLAGGGAYDGTARALQHLVQFIDEYQVPRVRVGAPQAAADQLTALAALRALLQRCLELMRLLVVVGDGGGGVGVPPVLAAMDGAERFHLESYTMKDLVVTGAGARCVQALIRALIDVDGAASGGALLDTLRRQCPSFVDQADLDLFNGLQMLHQAQYERSLAPSSAAGADDRGGAGARTRRQALQVLMRAAANVDFPLAQVVDRLTGAGLLHDVVRLCVHRAGELERLASSMTTTSAADDRLRRQTIAGRQKAAYQAACTAVDQLRARSSPALRAALADCFASTSPAFLNDYLFPFYLRHLPADYDQACPAFEAYLVRHRLFDRLRQYWVALRRYADGARFFAALPYDDDLCGPGASVRDRIRHLEVALEFARYDDGDVGGAGTVVPARAALTADLRKAIALGEVQADIIARLTALQADDADDDNDDTQADLAAMLGALHDSNALYACACRHRLFEACLRILQVEDSRAHGDVVAALYANIVSALIQSGEERRADWRPAVRACLARLGRLYAQTAFLFPVGALAELLEQHDAGRGDPAAAPGRDGPSFVVPLLLDDCEVPVGTLLGVYAHLWRHWPGADRTRLADSIAYLLAPAHLDAVDPVAHERALDEARDLADLCYSMTTGDHQRALFGRLRDHYRQKQQQKQQQRR